ncbi:MAG: MBL fold metallo-hydrolase [Deltaproteobacteria bacterium]|nr:MBL fold metallo-hydrolase [Deltaproteobacteria bacterium]MBW2387471.1 MBL fold metallo-hydrolase [Deltaproteobacteria bacterium]MBW2723292.1 MBL fold metallo-hydrolase [Deltaproteobacteria bacterium]
MKLKIASRWFERTNVGDGLTLLREPYAHPLLRCNIWHVRGRDCDLLIDTGLGVASLRDEIADLTDKPLITLATHIHYDHVGSLHEFETRLMHPLEAPLMSDYRQFCALATSRLPQLFLDGLEAMGMPVTGDALIDALPHAEFDPDAFQTQSVEPTREVDEGDGIDLGDRHFEILHLPGHSVGSVGLWEQETRTLFSGDAIYDGPLLDELEDSNIPDYVATMKRLRELPVDVVHGGHDESFGRDRLIEIADGYIASRS